jgi:hypothetical protein
VKPIPAIVEKQVDIERSYSVISVALAGERDAGATAVRHEQLASAAREAQKLRRLEIGRELLKVRAAWPERGPKAKGWGEFLQRLKIDQSTAWRYMHPEQAEPSGFMQPHENPDRDVKPENDPIDRAVAGLQADVDAMLESADDPVIDRDTWCTPPELTTAIGEFELDPCSNERSTVSARTTMDITRGVDGLAHAEDVEPDWRVFLNPPYSDVAPWIAAYAHTRFCFLLKLDTSTRWFADLYALTQLILIPRKRVQFDPPPGVPPEKAHAQQFPHALFYARAEDATPEIRALCWAWRIEHDTSPAT